jgi:hypothetical protein
MQPGTRHTDDRRPQGLFALAWAMCVLCALASACARVPLERDKPCWLEDSCGAPPLSPDANPTELPMGAVIEGDLHCGEGDCQNWYRVGVAEEAAIRIELRAVAGSEIADAALVLLDSDGQKLIRPEQASRYIQLRLAAGSYQLGVVALGNRERPLRYAVAAEQLASPSSDAGHSITRMPTDSGSTRTAARRAATVGWSQPGWIRSEVIEVAANPVGILIDAGSTQGLHEGQQGELVLSGRTIARIELVEVYESGSRARVVGALHSPIDPLKTEARIYIAPASRAR